MTSRVVQVTNIAPQATKEQMTTLFGFLGKIEELKLYPSEDSLFPLSSRVCYVKFADQTSVGVAQHLTNTVFIDRALIVVPINETFIPDEEKAMAIAAPASAVAGLVPQSVPSMPANVVNQVQGVGSSQVITTIDPRLTALGLPQYPPLPGNMDPSKIEEIRRTVYVGNLDSTITAEQLLNFFNQVGEVKYVRMAGDETQPTRFAFVEFTEQTSVAAALQYNSVIFGGRPLKVNHSNNAIVKPQAKSNEAAQREIEEAMKRVREAQSLITAAIEPELVERKRSRSASRSRSHSRRRSRSRSRRRSRSHSPKRVSHRRSRSSRSRSRSPRRRSKSRERRSRSKDQKHKKRSRSKSPKSSKSTRTRDKKEPKEEKIVVKKEIAVKEDEVDEEMNEIDELKAQLMEDKETATSTSTSTSPAPAPAPAPRVDSTNIPIKMESPPPPLPPPPPPPPTSSSSSKKRASSRSPSTSRRKSKSPPPPASRKKSRSRSRSRRKSSRSPRRRRSRSRSRRKSRSRSRRQSRSPIYRPSPARSHRRKLSPSPPIRRKLSRSPIRRKMSRSPIRRKMSRSPIRRKMSRSPIRRKLSRSPSHRRKLSRSPSHRRKLSRSPIRRRSRSRTPPKRRASRSRSRSRSPRHYSKYKKEKRHQRKHRGKEDESSKDTKITRDYDEEEKGYDSPASRELVAEGPALPPPPVTTTSTKSSIMAASGHPRLNGVMKKLKTCVAEGNLYEAHQLYRMLYFRGGSIPDCYAELMDTLHDGSLRLLCENHKESGADVAALLVDILIKSNTVATEEIIEKLVRLYKLMNPDSPERSNFIHSALKWSNKLAPEYISGHPKLHESIALILWKEKNYPLARYHFLHSTDADGCASMLIDYHTSKGYSNEVDLFIAQAVFQYLCLRNKTTATLVFASYTEKHPDIDRGPPYFFPLLNFLWFLLRVVECGKSRDAFSVLCQQYQPTLSRDPTYNEYLERIGHLFFGLPPAKKKSAGVLSDLLQTFLGNRDSDDESDGIPTISAQSSTVSMETEELD
uniref:RRM domain-containing protein n=1 Tax=Strigamia maritima TaxID=126957 RepID=T1JH00_STRMM